MAETSEVDETKQTNNNNSIYRTLIDQDGRTISYCIRENAATVANSTGSETESAESPSSVAIVMFYSLSGCSKIVQSMKDSMEDYRCKIVCVDRPLCGETSKTKQEEETALGRIHAHTHDVLTVLEKERITKIYVLGICLGHVYAVDLCRHLLQTTTAAVQVHRLALVAPFVSTACPNSWWIARLGSWVPKSVLFQGTEAMTGFSSWITPYVLSPSTLRTSLPNDDLSSWTEEDFVEVAQLISEFQIAAENVKAIEARLGTCPSWQQVCDDFAVENGHGLFDQEGQDQNQDQSDESLVRIPVTIHATPHDTLAVPQSVEWIAKRCYGGTNIIYHDHLHSHAMITMGGGPPRNPVLFHRIARYWHLLPPEEQSKG